MTNRSNGQNEDVLNTRLSVSTPDTLAENIITSARSVAQVPRPQTKTKVPTLLGRFVWLKDLLSQPQLAFSLLMATIAIVLLASNDTFVTPASTNPYAHLSTQELQSAIAELELQEIWLIQDELMTL